MHSGLHSLAHRAPGGATRTSARVRWQPYNSLPSSASSPLTASSISSRSPQTNYLNTPSSVSPVSAYSTPASSFDSKPTPTPSKDSSKNNKYALGLVDQAVKCLCEIWRPQDIPTVFLSVLPSVGGGLMKNELSAQLLTAPMGRNTQLPSPISPNTNHHSTEAAASTASIESSCMFGSQSNLVPIKGFVHEVLRRSRTSGCVLQTALCYLEAIRSRVPELVQQEKTGQGSRAEPDITSRITVATAAEIEQDALLSLSEDCDEIALDTVRISDFDYQPTPVDEAEFKRPKPPTAPLPSLPSPLLCPRRAFLASLILASKFSQDKCYSNRAWAKLSGLPAREIGRCERAFGDALDWRLWVGKTKPPMAQASTTAAPPLISRSLSRCQSESNLRTPTKSGFLVRSEDPISVNSSSLNNFNNLRRSSTLPSIPQGGQWPPSTSNLDSSMGISPGLQSLSMMPSVHTEYSSYSDDDECPPTEVINPYPPVAFSPCPSLTYSPSSSDSSSGGDRTIQMSSFSDDGMFGVNMGAPVESETWLESPHSAQTLKKHCSNSLYRQFGGPRAVKASGAIPFGHNPQMISRSQDTQIQRFDIGQEYLASKYSAGIDRGGGGGIWNTESFWG